MQSGVKSDDEVCGGVTTNILENFTGPEDPEKNPEGAAGAGLRAGLRRAACRAACVQGCVQGCAGLRST